MSLALTCLTKGFKGSKGKPASTFASTSVRFCWRAMLKPFAAPFNRFETCWIDVEWSSTTIQHFFCFRDSWMKLKPVAPPFNIVALVCTNRSLNRAVFNWVSKVISELHWFCITSLRDWFNVFALLFQPIRSETKTNCGSRVHIFPRFVSATCNYLEFWLVYWIVSVIFDWPK